MPTLTQDLRHATRALLKDPGYLVTAVLTLALRHWLLDGRSASLRF